MIRRKCARARCARTFTLEIDQLVISAISATENPSTSSSVSTSRSSALTRVNNFKARSRETSALSTSLRAATASDAETETAANAPFLFTRIRARIAEERRRREEAGGWQSLPLVAWRAVPLMAIVALLTAVLTMWTAQPSTPATGFGIYEEALSDTNDPGVEQTILSRNNLSHDEIFSIVLDRNDGRKGR